MKKMFVLLGLLLTLNIVAGERSALLIKYTSGEEVVVQTGIGLLELKQSYDQMKKTFLLSVNQTACLWHAVCLSTAAAVENRIGDFQKRQVRF